MRERKYKLTPTQKKLSLGTLAVAVLISIGILIHNPLGVIVAGPKQFSWQVAITSGNGLSGYSCSGVLVGEDNKQPGFYWVLTAAHCVHVGRDDQYFVLAGEKRKDVYDGFVQASLRHSHPGFVPCGAATKAKQDCLAIEHDVALLKFKLPRGKEVEVIPIAPASATDAGLFVAGWTCKPGDPVIEWTLGLALKLVGSNTCGNQLVYTDVELADSSKPGCPDGARFICAEAYKGVDPRDSGSGLTTGIEQGAQLVGIAHAIDEGKNQLNVYSRVSADACWINSCMSGACKVECD